MNLSLGERILNDDLESYWDKKPSFEFLLNRWEFKISNLQGKQDKPEDEQNKVNPIEQNKNNEVKETMAVHPAKKKNVVDNVDLWDK